MFRRSQGTEPPAIKNWKLVSYQPLVRSLFSPNMQGMDEKHARPVSRADLEHTIEFALQKVRRQWPTRRPPGDHDCLMPLAAAVVDHLEFCDMYAFGEAPPPSRTSTAAAGDVVGARSKADQRHGIPVARADLVNAIACALKQVRRAWPKRRLPGGDRRLGSLARQVVKQLETSHVHVFQESAPAPAAAFRR